MKVSVNSKVFEKLPDYHIGVAVITGIRNSDGPKLKPVISSQAESQIKAWENAAAKLGINSKDFPQANFNLTARFTADHQLPKINPVVDLANVHSLETGLPIGIHDLDKVGDIQIRPGTEGDKYTPLNQTASESVIDPLVYATGHKVMTRNWTWRLSQSSKVEASTTSIILFIDALHPQSSEETRNLTTKVVGEIISHFGGKLVDTALLDKSANEAEFDLSDKVQPKTMDQIDELLNRGVANVIPGRSELEKVLRSGKKLNIYLGIDPTATRIHIGHAVPLRKLQEFVELGHHVTFLIGDFTALIGDTSDKDTERPVLTPQDIENNFQTYKQQAAKILDFSKVGVVHNSEWLGKLNFGDIVKLTRHFSLNDFISRELIKKRLTDGRSVSLPEVLYPVMQGYDSYHLDTDVQVGGTDQTFNMQAGRTLNRDLRSKESFVLSLGFLEGTDGRKMSKSWGNAIWIEDSPEEMFGKLMRLKDELIVSYYTLATRTPQAEIATVKSRLDSGENPMVLKKELAHKIVSELHSKALADSAQNHFEHTIQNRETVITGEVSLPEGSDVLRALIDSGLVKSNSEARRLIEQGGVKLNGTKVSNYNDIVKSGTIISVGSRNHIKVK